MLSIIRNDNYNKYELHPRESKPLGKPWTEWIARWWRWCLADHIETSPAADNTGQLCDKNQNDSNVWFLAGTFGGKAKRKCIISREKSILFPIVNDLISYAEYKKLVNESDLRRYAKDDLDTTTLFSCIVDDIHLHGLEKYRIQSELFELTIPLQANGVVMPALTKAISDGYWIFLKPLSIGEHIIFFRGEKSLYDEIQSFGYKGENGMFKVEVEYSIVVR